MKSAHIHWLLELMVINPLPLAWVLPNFDKQHTNSLPVPGYKPEDYARLLVSALREGSIELLSDDRTLGVDQAVATVTAVGEHKLERPVNGSMLRLTAAGGRVWEKLAEPRWDRFFKFELTYISSEPDDLRVSGLLASENRDAVIAYLGWFERLESVDVRWDTLTLETCANYEATYWKTLPDMHEATFDGLRQETDRLAPSPVWEWKMSLGNWHVKPWDRPDWS